MNEHLEVGIAGATKKQLLKANLRETRALKDLVLTLITAVQEGTQLMTDINSNLDTLGADIQTELQQVRDAVAAAQAAIGDKAAVEQALADAQGVIDSASARVQAFSSDLQADDPAGPPA